MDKKTPKLEKINYLLKSKVESDNKLGLQLFCEYCECTGNLEKIIESNRQYLYVLLHSKSNLIRLWAYKAVGSARFKELGRVVKGDLIQQERNYDSYSWAIWSVFRVFGGLKNRNNHIETGEHLNLIKNFHCKNDSSNIIVNTAPENRWECLWVLLCYGYGVLNINNITLIELACSSDWEIRQYVFWATHKNNRLISFNNLYQVINDEGDEKVLRWIIRNKIKYASITSPNLSLEIINNDIKNINLSSFLIREGAAIELSGYKYIEVNMVFCSSIVSWFFLEKESSIKNLLRWHMRVNEGSVPLYTSVLKGTNNDKNEYQQNTPEYKVTINMENITINSGGGNINIVSSFVSSSVPELDNKTKHAVESLISKILNEEKKEGGTKDSFITKTVSGLKKLAIGSKHIETINENLESIWTSLG